MKIGIIKPDYKITGGFEVVVNHIKAELEYRGHNVDIVNVDATKRTLNDIPCSIDSHIFQQNADFFRYINYFWKYLKMDLSMYDIVISTQPPSFAIQHPRHIALFYHHSKAHYDLSELFQEVGLHQPYHRKAQEVIREIDSLSLSKVSIILAGSNTIKERIAKFNNLSVNVDLFYAGIDKDIYNYSGPLSYNYPIVVGRHEFPKRPELFVNAMKKLPNSYGRIIGEGGRTDDLKRIDQLLTYTSIEGIYIPDDVIWKKLSNGFFEEAHSELLRKSKRFKHKSNVVFTGRVSREQLFKEYADALCVVCPAFEEDYGLTAIEAMAFSKPVIACADGGGYVELIKDGVNGFIVEPNSVALAEAIRKLVDDPELARTMGENAFQTSRLYSWDNAINKISETILK
ncbi:glycosyltransferase family 4 protein [Paenibacillus monticola]|uniref:Glycosyltransferase n=1 Tax=Paenibacillus monticola TaxID=2666075 RepID=A0A7X2L2N3_9BACL|nr:glycosyltransferase family 4 protein [Paenibacillus monticola]MRN54368.1 glycosyltransferase [Paenibacillus monticola]